MGEQGVFMYVSARKLDREWWRLSKAERKETLENLRALELGIRNSQVRRYLSLRWDADLIHWVVAEDTSDLGEFAFGVRSLLDPYSRETFSSLSIYEPSPYLRPNFRRFELEEPPLRYFIAYPMKKDVNWYLLPFDERKQIMAEHIGMARSHPESGQIRSYTTYSFGLGDQEYVVLYEASSLTAWSHVTEKLREAKARKWIVKEEPILVGELRNDVDWLLLEKGKVK